MAGSLEQETVKFVAMTGNEAVAEAMRQINPDVVAAYPITPQTEIVQIFSTFVADGLVKTEFVTVESEHSAMSATIGAAAAGARAMTATSSQGFALMWEMLYIAAGLRLPIVMPVVNRALSSPINIHCDHSDTMGARDSGWIQIFSENAQEAYDNLIQAVRIAESRDVLLPAMVCMDGFIVSHGMESVKLLMDEEVRGFIGEYEPAYSLLDVDHPITVGALDFADWYFEHKRQEAAAEAPVAEVVLKVGEEYGKLTGRSYGLFEAYRLDDAEVAVVALGSTAGTAKAVVDELRQKGVRAGLLKIRLYRPFPKDAIVRALSGVKAIAVLDRSDTFSTMGGPVFIDIKASMYDLMHGEHGEHGEHDAHGAQDAREARDMQGPRIVNYIYGLGGRDIDLEQIRKVYERLQAIVATGETGEPVSYLGVRE
ncbi:MAG TPA: pyruvate ferredoxin oxidoreductase [Firmicutes bacterium]|nr:pyruvate ferredoxin oxidoreductase [Bacillota bacterium]